MKQNTNSIFTPPISNLFTRNTDPDLLSQMLQNAHGKIPYNMTNDYMFRTVLQANNKVLRGLICSLLHLEESEVHSVTVTNPIVLGTAIHDKEIRLDINVMLNDRNIINLEMQVTHHLNWQNRSLLYLSRSFDNLNRGRDYLDVHPAMHIGFLDYTLFPDHPEFYATYKLTNMKNHHVYSDNFVLSVVNLSCINLATEEDKQYHIDAWARLFKATTWEEVRQMAATNEYLQEASKSIFQFNTEEQIRKMCLDREEYYLDQRRDKQTIAQQETEIAALHTTIDSLQATIDGQQITIDKQQTTIDKQQAIIADLQANIDKLFTLVQQPVR